MVAKRIVESRARAGMLDRDEPAGREIGQEIDPDRLAVPPVRRHLQDRRAAQPLMRKQRRLAKFRLARFCNHFRRNARERAEQCFLPAQRQRHQSGPRLDHLQPEFARQIIGKAGRAHLRDRRAAGGDDERRGGRGAVPHGDAILAVGVADVADRVGERDLHPAPIAFVLQHRDDLLGRSVAEELPERLFVPGDLVRIDQRDEIRRRVATERRFGIMRVGRDIAIGCGVDVGEIAPPPARNQDLLADRIGVIDQQDAPPALAGGEGAHQPGRARAEDDGVVGHFVHAAAQSAI